MLGVSNSLIGPYLEIAKPWVSRLVGHAVAFARLVNYEYLKIVTVNFMNYTSATWPFFAIGDWKFQVFLVLNVVQLWYFPITKSNVNVDASYVSYSCRLVIFRLILVLAVPLCMQIMKAYSLQENSSYMLYLACFLLKVSSLLEYGAWTHVISYKCIMCI